MPGWIDQKLKGLLFRYYSYKYGILYGSSSSFRVPDRLKVPRGYQTFSFKRSDEKAFEYEFKETCISDAYQLRYLKKRLNVSRIVDIGANQGLFILAARSEFPKARIDAYEPNPDLQKALDHNAALLNARIYYEAVAKQDGKVDLQFTDSDLETRTILNGSGKIEAVSLEKVVDRAGGLIDILKMDCEGAEWDIFENAKPFESVCSITMEYHLWAKAGSTLDILNKRLDLLGFKVINQHILSASFGLLTAVKK